MAPGYFLQSPIVLKTKKIRTLLPGFGFFYGHRSGGEGQPLLFMYSPGVAFSHLRHDADGVRLRLCVSEREPILCSTATGVIDCHSIGRYVAL